MSGDSLPRGLTLPIYTVDAFADLPFSGNQAAVVLVPVEVNISDVLLQKIAAEMKYADTAFIQQLSVEGNFRNGKKFGLRWFSPTTEVILCGHGTLASSAVMFEEIGNKHEVIEFQTVYSGSLYVRKSGDDISIELPLNKTSKKDQHEFGNTIQTFSCGMPVQDIAWNDNLSMLLIRLPDILTREQFESFKPDIRKAEQETDKIKMVTVTMKADPSHGFRDHNGRPFDFVSRFFAPWFGVDEDSVTGVAHTVLADYWSKELNKTNMYARQCSQRGGNVTVHVKGDRVELTGKGIVIVRGTISF